jgi:hypothetical protein
MMIYFRFIAALSNPRFNLTGDGSVGLSEFRVDCVNRMAYKTIKELDDSFDKLLNVSVITALQCSAKTYRFHLIFAG